MVNSVAQTWWCVTATVAKLKKLKKKLTRLPTWDDHSVDRPVLNVVIERMGRYKKGSMIWWQKFTKYDTVGLRYVFFTEYYNSIRVSDCDIVLSKICEEAIFCWTEANFSRWGIYRDVCCSCCNCILVRSKRNLELSLALKLLDGDKPAYMILLLD